MGDRLEKFVEKHREEFDVELPSEVLWDKIRKQSNPYTFGKSQYWKIAAVFFLISTLALLIDRVGFNLSEDNSSTAFTADFRQVESYYVGMIEAKRNEVLSQSDTQLSRSFLKEIEQLDVVYSELKEVAKLNNPGTTMTDAMINNLQMRIEILNKQLAILKSLKNEKDEVSNIEI
ncbi:MAG: hypothetical protein ACI83W_000461 [Marinoscillum sp.]|jgi:hypothetical protein